MAFRRIIRVKESPVKRRLKRLVLGLTLSITLIVGLLMLCVNGSTIREPLANLLSKALGLEVTIDKAEFSPLYPQVLKLSGVTIGTLQAGEIYVEYSLPKLLFERQLHFYDFYLKAAHYTPQALEHELFAALAANPITADALRLNGIALHTARLQAREALVRLYNVTLQPQSSAVAPTLSFDHGRLSLKDAKLDALPCSNLTVSFKAAAEGFIIDELQANLLGGTLQGSDGLLKPAQNSLHFKKLHAARLVLKDGLSALQNYALSADSGTLSAVFAALPSVLPTEFNLNTLSGSFKALQMSHGKIKCDEFNLQAAEAALPKLPLSLSDAQFSGSLKASGELKLKLSADFLEGTLQAALNFKPQDKQLDINELTLHNNKLELTEQLFDFLMEHLHPLTLNIGSAHVYALKFLSFMPQLPLSIESLSLQGEALALKDGKLQGNSAGLINADFNNLLYGDLLFSRGSGIVTVSDEVLSFTLPEIALKRSVFSLVGALSFNQAQSFLIFNAPHLQAEELNSEYLGHVLQGEVALQADLRAPGPFKFDTLPTGISGSLRLSAPSLLISQLGLDLINGGTLQGHTLDGTTLLSALAPADCGLYQLRLSCNLDGTAGVMQGTAHTPSSEITLHAATELADGTLSGEAVLTSLPGDSITTVKLQGSLHKPEFVLQPVKRGAERPGLFFMPHEAAVAPSASTAAQTAGMPPSPSASSTSQTPPPKPEDSTNRTSPPSAATEHFRAE